MIDSAFDFLVTGDIAKVEELSIQRQQARYLRR